MRKRRCAAQEGALRSDDWRYVSTVTESRGVQYSAESAGDGGSVRCHVLRRELAHERRAQFTIVVCNDSDADAQALAFVPAAAGDRYRNVVQTIVGAGSNFSTSVTLALTPAGATPELRVVVTNGAEAEFTLVVPGEPARDGAQTVPALSALPARGGMPTGGPPVARGPYPLPVIVTLPPVQTARRSIVREPERSRTSPPVLPIVLVFVALLGIAGIALLRPQIGEFTLPNRADGGANVPVSYRVTGLGRAEYAMFGPDGQTVSGGALAVGSGTFVLSLPRTPAVPAYLVRLRMSNPLGAAIAQTYLHVNAPPAPVATAAPRVRRAEIIQPPQIRSLALDRASLASGDILNVYYDVLATRGSVALYDPATQITFGRVDITPTGHATFAAPHVDAARFLTVIVTAQRGTSTTQSRIGVTVTAPDAAGPGAGATGDPGSAAGGAAIGPATVLSAPASVRANAVIHVEIGNASPGLQLVFLDANGTEIARRAIVAGQSSVDFTAPAVASASRFVIEGTYPSGAGSETIVRPIIVKP